MGKDIHKKASFHEDETSIITSDLRSTSGSAAVAVLGGDLELHQLHAASRGCVGLWKTVQAGLDFVCLMVAAIWKIDRLIIAGPQAEFVGAFEARPGRHHNPSG